ncbi:MAG: LLM class flavin-dependent oxidoreductase [Rugosibacter sp.]|nr:LLM class flavin-dependent oxidoreductase [Rugosibacter sp.]
MIPFSVLDLSPIVAGGTASQSLANSLDLARHAERLGYHRYWVAEHHGIPGIASAATAVVIGHVAAGTQTIRVGAGGIMLPNHSPLVIAEQFGTLEALFPGRIDLGLGRAPGSDQATARALRRNLAADENQFPRDVVELMAYFAGTPVTHGGQAVHAIPGEGAQIPVWILGSSLFGATLAAALGLPFSFASHFAPAQMQEAIHIYRTQFRPSAHLATPYVMLGFSVFAADTDAQGRFLASSMQQMILNLRRGRPTTLQPPVDDFLGTLAPAERAMLEEALSCSAIGSPDTVRAAIKAFIARTGADELVITCQIFDHAARKRSYEIAAGVRQALAS